jgi:hypothetical protein
MEERLQKALDDFTAMAQQSRLLSADEQDVIAARLEAMASALHWELLFHTPEDALTSAAGIRPPAREDSATPASAM